MLFISFFFMHFQVTNTLAQFLCKVFAVTVGGVFLVAAVATATLLAVKMGDSNQGSKEVKVSKLLDMKMV